MKEKKKAEMNKKRKKVHKMKKKVKNKKRVKFEANLYNKLNNKMVKKMK